MRTVQRIQKEGNATQLVAVATGEEPGEIPARVALIQASIPLGLEAVADELRQEVETLAGQPHARQGRRPGLVRWGQQRGSVYLADQKLPVVVPRVRDRVRELVERGFAGADGLLVVIDGAKGLRAAVAAVFGAAAQVQRCQWHKRENVVRHLPRSQQAAWRRKLQAAYAKPTYAQARAAPRASTVITPHLARVFTRPCRWLGSAITDRARS